MGKTQLNNFPIVSNEKIYNTVSYTNNYREKIWEENYNTLRYVYYW